MPDPASDYYAVLGVSSTASLAEIKAVYRALVRIYHPDVNSDKAATEKFRKITEAYEVLSHTDERARYDALFELINEVTSEPINDDAQKAAKRDTEEKIELIICSACKKITLQPRHLVFTQVISIIFTTVRTPKQGIFCTECAQRESFRASAISALFGWWGVPWGPILTVKEILSNAGGGTRKSSFDDQMKWHNALAYVQRQDFSVAGSIAATLTSSVNKDVAEAARRLLTELERGGLTVKRLKDSWTFNTVNFFKHVVMLAVVPAAIFFAVYLSNTFADGSSVKLPQKLATTLPQGNKNEATTSKKFEAESEPEPVNLCKRRPRNGQVFGFEFIPDKYGHKLTINNGSEGDAIVKLRDLAKRQVVVSFFVQKGSSVSIIGIADGQYKAQFAFGEAMKKNCKSFVKPDATEFDGVVAFRTRRTKTQIVSQEWTYTLYQVQNGNAKGSKISSEQFED
jgi:DnaJ domain